VTREEVLRRLLGEHADTVIPAGGLEEIRARTAVPRRPWWRRWWDRLNGRYPHTCDPREDPLFPDDVRCRICGERPCKNAAPVSAGAAPNPTAVKEPKVTTIIQRRARALRAGDIIIRDPDHRDLPVRWRVGRRPTLSADGVVIIDYTDITDEPRAGIAHFDALTVLTVEPVGGAA
jgi:hypothetical protein